MYEVPRPFTVGTPVQFQRSGRKGRKYEKKTWTETGRIKRVDIYSYLIETEKGEMFIRKFAECSRIEDEPTES